MKKGLKTLGFTMIELIIVIAIIGILAAVAVPKFISLTSSASSASASAVAGALASAASNNFAARSLSSANGSAVANCTDVGALLQGGLPSGYTITSLAISAGTTATCTVTGPNSSTATFSATGIA